MNSQLPILLRLLHFLLLISSCLSQISKAASGTPPYPSSEPIKAVNLGGWLVVEGWMKPSLFDEIPVNKDLLDGTQIQLKSVTHNKFLSAENGGGSTIVANRSSASGWETFKLWRITETMFQFRVFNWQFFGLDHEGNLMATSIASNDSDSSHTFLIVRQDYEPNRIRIRASNGFYLQVKPDSMVIANYPTNTSWGDDDPSVFEMTNVYQLKGEFQVTNGYGPYNSAFVMKEHWNSFIVENDFKFISENGLNAVRIPVGWWIQFDHNPPRPFVGGSLRALDNAFYWAEKYDIKVIIDIHAMQSSQNGWEHSGTRDGLQSWGQSDDDIDQSIVLVDFLASRFFPSKQAIHQIRDIIRSMFDGPYSSWKKIPSNVRDVWFREFQRHFTWLPEHNDRIRRNFERRASSRLRDMFTDIRKSEQRPPWIGEAIWAQLCAEWHTPEYVQMREKNKQNRASDCGGAGTSLHTGGSIPHTEHRRRLKEMLGRDSSMAELHQRTHQRQKSCQWVDQRSEHVHTEYVRMREHQTQSSQAAGSSTQPSEFETWQQVVGGKKKGRIYGLGSVAHAASSSSQSMDSSGSTMETIIKRHMESIHKQYQDDFRAIYDQNRQYEENMRLMQDQIRRLKRSIGKGKEVVTDKAEGEDEEEEAHSDDESTE